MNNLDVAGILMTYSELAKKAADTETLHDIVWRLRRELDLRKIRMEG